MRAGRLRKKKRKQYLIYRRPRAKKIMGNLNSADLISTVFHELRTPISSINGYASILLSFEQGRLNKAQAQTVNRISRLCENLTYLINNLLQLSKLEHSSSILVKKKKIFLGRLITQSVQTLSFNIRDKKLHVSARPPEALKRVWADEDGFARVFMNLLSNAIKFTPRRGRVKIDISYKPRGRHLLISVADTGVGIAPDAMPKIFQEFYHEDKPEVGAIGGTGLGLCIVKKIVEAHNGKIWIKSRPKKGTVVFFTVPVITDEEAFEDYFMTLKDEAQAGSTGFSLIYIAPAEAPKNRRIFSEIEGIVAQVLRKDDRIFLLDNRNCAVALVEGSGDAVFILRERIQERLCEAARRGFLIGTASFPKDAETKDMLFAKAKQSLN